MVNQPKQRKLNQLSTKVLIDRHCAHDLAIAEKNGYTLDDSYSHHDAKSVKVFVKQELTKRAKAGDAEAIAYATKRKWFTTASNQVLVAAE